MSRWGRVPIAVILLAVLGALITAQSLVLWQVVTFLFTVVAVYEWARLSSFSNTESLIGTVFFAVLVGIGELWIFAVIDTQRGLWGAAMIFWVCVAPCCLLVRNRYGRAIWMAIGIIVIYAAWRAAAVLYEENTVLLLSGLAAVWGCDTMAFIIGRSIGRTPFFQSVSPNKTMEGFLGGIFVVLGLAAVFYHWNDDGSVPFVVMLAIAFALANLAILGDLFESWLKRRSGVKDSGVCLGAHGGVLDRIDALLPVLPFIALSAL